MVRKNPEQTRARAAQRIEAIRTQIAAIEFVCSGTLLERTKVCGKPSCRCAQDPRARHGPYYEWTRMVGGKLVHRVVSPEQARFIRETIANKRAVLKLLRRWEGETIRVIETLGDAKR